MKDFFKQQLEELEDRVGIRQVYWLQQRSTDQVDFDKKKNILLDSMVLVSKEFDYIPEAAQKSIIASQIVKDQEYEGLNSRVIWKWLNAFKSPYLNPAQLQDKEVVFEPQSEETKIMIKDYLANLSGEVGKPILKDSKVEAEMVKIEKEDKERVERVSLSSHYKADPEVIVMQELRKRYAKECTNLVTGRRNENAPTFEEWLATDV